MSPAKRQPGEAERLAALASYAILDTPPEAEFDEIADTVRAACRVPVALVSLVDRDRQWFKARRGTDLTETPIETSVCALVVATGRPLVIEDLSRDSRTAHMSLVTAPPHLRFYAGAPIVTRGGAVLGSLCAIDTAPRPDGLAPEQRVALTALADQVAALIETRVSTAASHADDDEHCRQRRALADSAVLGTVAAVQRRALQAGGGPEELLKAVVEGAITAIARADGAVALLADGTDLIYRIDAGRAVAEIGLRVPIATTLSGRCFRERRALLVADVRTLDEAEAGHLLAHGICSVVLVPLARHGTTIGVLAVYSTSLDAFRSRHVLIATVLGEMIAAGLGELAEFAARQAAARVEQRYREVVDSAIDSAIISTDPDGIVTSWSRGAERITGWPADEMTGRSIETMFTPEDRRAGRHLKELREAAELGRASGERWHLRRDGSRFFAFGSVTPLIGAGDGGFVKSMRDVTEEAAIRRSLADSKERLELTKWAARVGSFEYLPPTGHLEWDDRCRELFGLSPGMPVSYEGTFLAGVHPDDRARTDAAVQEVLDPAGGGRFDIEYRTIGLEDGVERWIAASGLVLFEDGLAVRFIGTVQDVSESRRAQQALRAMNETLETAVGKATAQVLAREEQLRQSQKMEAVGQLTGGIAHDFNNMLTGIIGSLELLKRQLANGRTDRAERYIDAAATSAQRAASLTHRLLAFSRRQSLDVRPVEVDQLVAGLEDMLRRTLGEQIAMEVRLPAGLWPAVTDANQLESALLNLVINARDAMPGGGRLEIELANAALTDSHAAAGRELEAGDYVVLAVTDNGSGMSEDVIGKAFDPFFTTKPIGQGTGLGLSMIYGFVRQTGGHVVIESALGEGSTVRLFLPRHVGEIDPVAGAPVEVRRADHGECVLVVEDEPAVRMLIVEVLDTLGYEVIEAKDGRAAIPILEGSGRIDLLVSDVGLPGGLDGRQVAEIARAARPGLRILFVTGYAQAAAVRSGFLAENMEMIMKPFAVDALAAKVREMLEGAAAPAAE